MSEVRVDRMAHGGEAVGRSQGKAVFVAGVLPGELVEVEFYEERDSWARAALVSVVEPSDDRVEPRCRHFGRCGGCQWQFAERDVQAGWKRDVVAGQLKHLGKLPDADVRPTLMPGPAFGYRNRMDFRVERGQPALYRRGTREPEIVQECPVLAEPLRVMLEQMGELAPLRRVTLRAGIRTGDKLAVVSGAPPESMVDWPFPAARVRRGRIEPLQGEPHITERVDGVTFRVTASAFFQNNTAAAEALVKIVDDALEISSSDSLLDAYSGGGLFGLTVGRRAARVLAVESASLAIEDLAFNSAAAGIDIEIVRSPVERGVRGDWTVAVCDPPRTGLGRDGVNAIVRPRPRVIAYVACDPASLARDARLLDEAGYDLDYAIPVDMFPQTFHIETVARFLSR